MTTATAITLAGTALTLLSHGIVAVFVYGRLTERVKTQGEQLVVHSSSITDHGERISAVEGRLSTSLPCGMALPAMAKAAHR